MIRLIGRQTLRCIRGIGRVTVFMIRCIEAVFSGSQYIEITAEHIIEFAFFPLSTVALVSLFIGAALVMQVGSSPYYSSEKSILVAPIVSTSMIRELGPAIIALIMSGRVGSAYAAEIATMKMTEQIDALLVLNTKPYNYLFLPRIIAGVISLPLLTLVSMIIGIYGGYIAAIITLNIESADYIYMIFKSLKSSDIITGLLKSIVFGFAIPLMGCYHGYYCLNGERGVGMAATFSVLSSSVMIILINYLMTVLMRGI